MTREPPPRAQADVGTERDIEFWCMDFTTKLSDGRVVELLPGGAEKDVVFENRAECACRLRLRLHGRVVVAAAAAAHAHGPLPRARAARCLLTGAATWIATHTRATHRGNHTHGRRHMTRAHAHVCTRAGACLGRDPQRRQPTGRVPSSPCAPGVCQVCAPGVPGALPRERRADRGDAARPLQRHPAARRAHVDRARARAGKPHKRPSPMPRMPPSPPRPLGGRPAASRSCAPSTGTV